MHIGLIENMFSNVAKRLGITVCHLTNWLFRASFQCGCGRALNNNFIPLFPYFFVQTWKWNSKPFQFRFDCKFHGNLYSFCGNLWDPWHLVTFKRKQINKFTAFVALIEYWKQSWIIHDAYCCRYDFDFNIDDAERFVEIIIFRSVTCAIHIHYTYAIYAAYMF